MNLGAYAYQYRKTMVLAIPIVLSQVGQVTVNLVDSIMIGHVGTAQLAASAFANNVFIFGMLFGMGITIGLTPITGENYGKGKKEEVVKWLKNGMTSYFFLALIISAFMFGLYFIMPYLGQTERVVAEARPYYLLLCFSYMPFLLFYAVKQFLEGMGSTKYAMQITIISNVVNIVLNYVLIYGKFGFPELGLLGAGIGTLVARLVMPFLWLLYFQYLPEIKSYFVNARNEMIEWWRVKKLMAVGIPIGFQIVVEIAAFSIGAIMMGWISETALAGHQVAIGLAGATFMICLGISQATTIRISHQMGQKEIENMRSTAYSSAHLVLLFMTITALIFILARQILPLMFTEDVAVIEVAAKLLIVAAFFQLFDGFQVLMLSVLRGMSDVKVPMYIAVFSYLLLALPVSYLFAFPIGTGPQGIWYGYLVGLGFAGILYFIRFKNNLRKMKDEV